MFVALLPFELCMNNCKSMGHAERLRAQDEQLRSNKEQTLRKGFSQRVHAQYGPEHNQQQSGATRAARTEESSEGDKDAGSSQRAN